MVGSLQVSHKVAGKAGVLTGEQRVGHTLLPGATGSPNPVGMRVDVARNVIVDDSADGWDVQAAG